MLALGTSLVLVEWRKANLGCGHHIRRIQKEDLKLGRFGIFPLVASFLCVPSAKSEEPSATDVGFEDFFGVGGVEKRQLVMWSSHWKDTKRRPPIGLFGIFLLVASFCACPAPTPSRLLVAEDVVM